jgi:short-subunit dehydrogenase
MKESAAGYPAENPAESSTEKSTQIFTQKVWAVLGASRGLGRAVVGELQQHPSFVKTPLLLAARKKNLLEELARPGLDLVRPCDFTKSSDQVALCEELLALQRQERLAGVIYCAGGGPYGPFGAKAWADHEWAWAVTFLFPARLLHTLMAHAPSSSGNALSMPAATADLQLLFVGSAIAEDKPDPLAASYAAAKHALKGLVGSVAAELEADRKGPKDKTASADRGALQVQVKLFSPGYMDTDLLPKDAWPRRKSGLLQSPSEVAKDLVRLMGGYPWQSKM